MSLIDFQNSLSQSLQEEHNLNLWMGVALGDEKWLLNLQELKETNAIKNVSKNGLVKPWILGVSNFKGHIYAILDMGHLINQKTSLLTFRSIVTILHENYGLNLGILWDESLGLIDIKNLKDSPKNSTNNKLHKFCKKVWVDSENNLWNELDIESLASSEEVLNIRAF